MKKVFLLVALASTLLLQAREWSSFVEVDKNFSDHAVLQRERPIHITGSGDAGKEVSVHFGKEKATAVVGKDGRWCAVLKGLPAGGPYTLTVKGKEKTVVFQDVMVGEVWLASGQSNMEMPVYSPGPRWRDERYEEILKNAKNYPQLRLFNASLKQYMSPSVQQLQPLGQWEVCSARSAEKFSATALHFGMNLCKMLPGVPVGIVHASWSGTRIQPWISWKGYEKSSFTGEKKDAAFAQLDRATREKMKAEARAKYRQQTDEWIARFEAYTKHPEAVREWSKRDYDDSSWKTLPRAPRVLFPDDMDGVIWGRHTAVIPKEWVGHELHLSLGPVDDCDWTYVNGVLVGKTLIDTASYWYAPREYDIPAKLVHSEKVVIAVRIADVYAEGGFPLNGENMKLTCKDFPGRAVDVGKNWRFREEFAADMKALGGQPRLAVHADGDGDVHFPSTLYNSMIHPWSKYPLRGFIWYQGCSNVNDPGRYLAFQKTLIEDWRQAWGDPAMPFVITQLSGFQSHFEEIREAQRLAAQQVPHTGLAVTMDIGLLDDIHPHNKTDVGYRLACEAERLCYGRKTVSAGPMIRAMKREGASAVLTFDNVGGGLAARGSKEGKLNDFEIAGADGKFYPAAASIKGNTVVVAAPQVTAPRAVRFAWTSFAKDFNFFNKEGFPASPFIIRN